MVVAGLPRLARAVIEILLRVDGESDRVRLLLQSMAPFESKERLARWQLAAYLRFGHPVNDGDLDAWLESEVSGLRGIEAARLWRLLAVSRLNKSDSVGHAWLTSSCGGYHLHHWEAALRRRPALAGESGEIQAFLRRATSVAGPDAPGITSMEQALIAVEDADKAGHYEVGTGALLTLLERFPMSRDLREAARQRAILLMDAGLAARLETEFDISCDVELPVFDELERSPTSEPVEVNQWCERLERLGTDGHCESDEDRRFLESAGALERAIDAWIALGSTQGLIEASRLAQHAQGSIQERVRNTLISHLDADEEELREDTAASSLAASLVSLLSPGPERRDWCVRLLAADALPRTSLAPSEEPDDRSEDPHSPSNRIAAGEDLLAEGHVDGAASIASSLLGKIEDLSVGDRYLAFVRTIFRQSDVPLAFKESVGRHIRSRGMFARGLLELFATDPRAAHPMLEVLHNIGKDGEVSDEFRFHCLRAWLRVWRVTDTVPADTFIRPFMRRDGGLLVLAAASIAGLSDPLAIASEFLRTYPSLEHPPSTWARQLLDLGASSA